MGWYLGQRMDANEDVVRYKGPPFEASTDRSALQHFQEGESKPTSIVVINFRSEEKANTKLAEFLEKERSRQN